MIYPGRFLFAFGAFYDFFFFFLGVGGEQK